MKSKDPVLDFSHIVDFTGLISATLPLMNKYCARGGNCYRVECSISVNHALICIDDLRKPLDREDLLVRQIVPREMVKCFLIMNLKSREVHRNVVLKLPRRDYGFHGI